MYSIGIDIGTTNCKICIFELPALNLITSYSFVTPKHTSQYGDDFDVIALYTQLEQGLINLITQLKHADRIKNIVIASVGESGVLIDQDQHVVGPAITWYDTRTKVNLAQVSKQFSQDEIYAITGIPIHSNYSLTKILWLKDNYQIDLTRVKWLCMAEFIAYRLSGEQRAELSLASRTLVLDLKRHQWSEKIQTAFGLNQVFVKFAQSGRNFATLNRDLAAKLGAIGQIEVAIGGHDHMCGSIAAGLKEGEILNSTGTTEGLLLLMKDANFSQPFLRANLSNGVYVFDDLNTLYTSLPAAGYCIEWFKKTFAVDNQLFISLLDELTGKLIDIEYIKSHQSVFIPHLRGSGPPQRNIAAQALWYGFNENTRKQDALLTLFQGLCFELRNTLESVEQLTKSYHPMIKVIGAASKNPLWLQLKADILGREILSCNIPEAVCKGAVMLAAKQNGYIKQLDCYDGEIDTQSYKPNQQLKQHYDQIYQHYYKPIFDLKMKIELCDKEGRLNER